MRRRLLLVVALLASALVAVCRPGRRGPAIARLPDVPGEQLLARRRVRPAGARALGGLGRQHRPRRRAEGRLRLRAVGRRPHRHPVQRRPTRQTRRAQVDFDWDDESDRRPVPDPGPTPASRAAPTDGDRHLLDRRREHCRLHELYRVRRRPNGRWRAGSGRGLEPALATPCGPRAGPRPTPPACRSCPAWCAGTRWRPGTIDHAIRFTAPAHPGRLHLARPPPGRRRHRPEPAADGRVVPAEGSRRHQRLPGRGCG